MREPGSSVGPARRTLAVGFDPRANSIGFFRWLLAFAVIVSHAGPLAGFYGGRDLGVQISDEQSLGGVAVACFFFFSGFLITRSRRRVGTVRYFWRRCLRIMPAFWTALLVTAFVLAPIAWWKETGSFDGYWSADVDSPLTYFARNMFLLLDQHNIAGMGGSLPYAELGGYHWNGAAWTLAYEFKGYLLVGLLGLVGWTLHRAVVTAVAAAIIVVNGLMWSGHADPAGWGPLSDPFGHALLSDSFNLMLLAPFALGMLFALWADWVPIRDWLAWCALLVAAYTYAEGGWNVVGQYGLLYFLMWAAIRWTALNNWERFGDFSYGIYIFGWPLQQFGAYFGLHERGMLAYFVVLTVLAHAVAFGSWHLIEKPAMSLKDWSPRRPGQRTPWSLATRGPDPEPSPEPPSKRDAPGVPPTERLLSSSTAAEGVP